jgi:hypothetical protein
VTVSGLLPGDLVKHGEAEGLFVCQVPHPFYPGLMLVIWRLEDGWSFDALDSRQYIGEAVRSTDRERERRLRDALLGGGR